MSFQRSQRRSPKKQKENQENEVLRNPENSFRLEGNTRSFSSLRDQKVKNWKKKKLFRVVGNRISSLRGCIRKDRGQRDTEIYRIYRSKQKCTFSQLYKLETPDQRVVWVGFFRRFLSLACRPPSFAWSFHWSQRGFT